MNTNLKRTDPTPEIVAGMMPASGTGNYRSIMVARVAFNTTSTANAATNWVNPESGTVAAKVLVFFTTAGTGTFDLGVSSDGTGSNNSIFDGGTMSVGVKYRPGTNSTLGGQDESWVLLGPGGTGTNNSIVMVTGDTTASTAAGGILILYTRIGA